MHKICRHTRQFAMQSWNNFWRNTFKPSISRRIFTKYLWNLRTVPQIAACIKGQKIRQSINGNGKSIFSKCSCRKDFIPFCSSVLRTSLMPSAWWRSIVRLSPSNMIGNALAFLWRTTKSSGFLFFYFAQLFYLLFDKSQKVRKINFRAIFKGISKEASRVI